MLFKTSELITALWGDTVQTVVTEVVPGVSHRFLGQGPPPAPGRLCPFPCWTIAAVFQAQRIKRETLLCMLLFSRMTMWPEEAEWRRRARVWLWGQLSRDSLPTRDSRNPQSLNVLTKWNEGRLKPTFIPWYFVQALVTRFLRLETALTEAPGVSFCVGMARTQHTVSARSPTASGSATARLRG